MYCELKNNVLQWNNQTQRFDKFPVSFSATSNSFPFLKSKGNYLFYEKSNSLIARYNVVTGTEDTVAVKNSNYLFPVNEDTVCVRQEIGGSVLASFTAKTIIAITAAQFAEKFNDNRFFVTGSSSNFSFICFKPLKKKF